MKIETKSSHGNKSSEDVTNVTLLMYEYEYEPATDKYIHAGAS